MIIWTSKIETEPKVVVESMGIRSWRDRIEVTPFCIHWFREIKYEKNGGADWRTTQSKIIEIARPWEVKTTHVYYDGPHCAWDIGFLHIYWPRDNCKKCWGTGFGDDT